MYHTHASIQLISPLHKLLYRRFEHTQGFAFVIVTSFKISRCPPPNLPCLKSYKMSEEEQPNLFKAFPIPHCPLLYAYQTNAQHCLAYVPELSEPAPCSSVPLPRRAALCWSPSVARACAGESLFRRSSVISMMSATSRSTSYRVLSVRMGTRARCEVNVQPRSGSHERRRGGCRCSASRARVRSWVRSYQQRMSAPVYKERPNLKKLETDHPFARSNVCIHFCWRFGYCCFISSEKRKATTGRPGTYFYAFSSVHPSKASKRPVNLSFGCIRHSVLSTRDDARSRHLTMNVTQNIVVSTLLQCPAEQSRILQIRERNTAVSLLTQVYEVVVLRDDGSSRAREVKREAVLDRAEVV